MGEAAGVTGADVIRMARAINANEHSGSVLVDENGYLLERLGREYDQMIAGGTEPLEAGARAACRISRRRKAAHLQVFERCAVYTAAAALWFILSQNRYHRTGEFTAKDAKRLRDALEHDDVEAVIRIYGAKWSLAPLA